MRDLAAVAERLRMVQRARRRFLQLWEIQQSVVGPMLDHLAADVDADEADEGGSADASADVAGASGAPGATCDDEFLNPLDLGDFPDDKP